VYMYDSYFCVPLQPILFKLFSFHSLSASALFPKAAI
jgi:hypothetical protein